MDWEEAKLVQRRLLDAWIAEMSTGYPIKRYGKKAAWVCPQCHVSGRARTAGRAWVIYVRHIDQEHPS